MKIRVSILFLLALISCHKKQVQQVNEVLSQNTEASYTYVLVPNPLGGYGYEIFQNGQKIISQPHPPGLAGNMGFQTTDEARILAEFVMIKVRKGEMPPTVKKNELDSLLQSIKK